MAADRIAVAQRGVVLADAVGAPPKPRGRGAAAAAAAEPLTGPFLSPGSLTAAERMRLIDGIERVLEGIYTHLPLKRARYGFDPVQRLRILRSQLDELTDDAFHIELADIVTRLRDAHTRYAGPALLSGKVAVLPFLVEMVGSAEDPTYVVTKVGGGLDAAFKPGVVLEYWNGVPIDRAVVRHSEQEVGGRPDSLRAWAVQSLTLRALQYGPPPDEHWVVVGYRTVPTGGGAGQAKEIKIPWRVVDPNQIAAPPSGGPAGRQRKALRRTRAVDPAAEATRRAKMLLFAPHALNDQQASAPAPAGRRSGKRRWTADIIATQLTQTLKAMSIDTAGGPFGYLRIFAFDTRPDLFIAELVRLVPEFPDNGLVVDVRGNPGGYIWAAERALQLFTPNHIEPTRFSVLATPFARQMATIGDLAADLAPWTASLDAAVRNGELYAQMIPITDPAACNDLGQHYGGPVVLVGDSTTYSAGDLFSAGFVDNGIGPFICVGSATGAGGANVSDYADLRQALAGSPAALPTLPDGIGLSLSFRRATRAGPNEGLPIEDVGVAGTPYPMTRDDLLHDNQDLIAECIAVLRQQPFSRLISTVDTATRSIEVTTSGLDHLDMLVDGHPGSGQSLRGDATVTLTYPAGTATVELAGFSGGELRQRRRLSMSP
jgi:Peptidase family S41